jgi:hypothetical protein
MLCHDGETHFAKKKIPGSAGGMNRSAGFPGTGLIPKPKTI